MNREIKFRAWHPTQGMSFTPILQRSDYSGKVYCHGYDKDGSLLDLDLMQYTGLKDKNGKEIYDGDILRAGEDNFIIEVVWDSKGFWKCQYHYKGELNSTNGLIYAINDRARAMDCDCLVIGNIYENPELMERQNV